MRGKLFVMGLFLCAMGMAQDINTLVNDNLPNYDIAISNDTDNVLDSIFIAKPRKCLMWDGTERVKLSIRNDKPSETGKISLDVYYKNKKVFKSRIANLKPGEEFRFAVNLKEKGVDYSGLQFKIRKRKIYRTYQYVDK